MEQCTYLENLFPPFSHAARTAMCDVNEVDVRTPKGRKHGDVLTPADVPGVRAVQHKGRPRLERQHASPRLTDPRPCCPRCDKPTRLEAHERKFVRLRHLTPLDAGSEHIPQLQDGLSAATCFVVPLLKPICEGSKKVAAWRVWRHDDSKLLAVGAAFDDVTTYSVNYILREYADSIFDCGLDVDAPGWPRSLSPSVENPPKVTSVCARCLKFGVPLHRANGYLCYSCWKLEAKTQCQCHPHYFVGHTVAQSDEHVQDLMPFPSRRVEQSDFQGIRLQLRPFDEMPSVYPICPTFKNEAILRRVCMLREEEKKQIASMGNQLEDIKRAMDVLSRDENINRLYLLVIKFMQQDSPEPVRTFREWSTDKYQLVFPVPELSDSAIEQLIALHEKVVEEHSAELLCSVDLEQKQSIDAAERRRRRNRRKRLKRKQRRAGGASSDSASPTGPARTQALTEPEPQPDQDPEPAAGATDQSSLDLALQLATEELAVSEAFAPAQPAPPAAAEECVICLDGPREWAPTPCGHRHFCSQCVEDLRGLSKEATCPSCRSSISGWIRIHG